MAAPLPLGSDPPVDISANDRNSDAHPLSGHLSSGHAAGGSRGTTENIGATSRACPAGRATAAAASASAAATTSPCADLVPNP